MNRLISVYENHFLQLRHLPDSVKSTVIELVFSYRNGVETICIVVSSLESLLHLVNNLPLDFFEKTYYRYAVDLESINSNKSRVYRDSDDCVLIGHYIDQNGNVLETKKYITNTANKQELLIDRYDSNKNLIDSGEKEIVTSYDSWKGSNLVTLLAKQNNLHTIYLKKVDKDQCYVRVRDI